MIQMGNINCVSNRETWTEQLELRDDETGELFDLSEATDINIRIAAVNGCGALTAELGDGIEIFSTGIFQWRFTESQMRTLVPGEFNVGITIKFTDETIQILTGTVSIIDGIVE